MTVLWIYSMLVCAVVVLACLVSPLSPPKPVSALQSTQDTMVGGILFSPVLLFVILVGIKNFRK